MILSSYFWVQNWLVHDKEGNLMYVSILEGDHKEDPVTMAERVVRSPKMHPRKWFSWRTVQVFSQPTFHLGAQIWQLSLHTASF